MSKLYSAISFRAVGIALFCASLLSAGIAAVWLNWEAIAENLNGSFSPLMVAALGIGAVTPLFLLLFHFFPLPTKRDEQTERLLMVLEKIISPTQGRNSDLIRYFKSEYAPLMHRMVFFTASSIESLLIRSRTIV